MKKLSKKLLAGVVAAALVVVAAGFAGIFMLRIDTAKAQEIALNQTGGGEIVSQEIENEGLWKEYKYEIVNGSSQYEIEIGGFGNVKELEVKNGK